MSRIRLLNRIGKNVIESLEKKLSKGQAVEDALIGKRTHRRKKLPGLIAISMAGRFMAM